MRTTTITFAFLLVTAAPAQQSVRPEVLDAKARRMRGEVDQGSLIWTQLRAEVRLRNGNRLRGMVKDATMVERVEGEQYVPAAVDDARAGLRLWYCNSSSSFIFLPFTSIAEFEVRERLTSDQVAAIGKVIAAEQQRLAERRAQQLRALRPAGAVIDGSSIVTGNPEAVCRGLQAVLVPKVAEPATGSAPGGDEQHLRLLLEFPPAAGWSAERKAGAAGQR